MNFNVFSIYMVIFNAFFKYIYVCYVTTYNNFIAMINLLPITIYL